jgi:hypothetical protein
MSPARTWRKFRKFRERGHRSFPYHASGVGVEGRIVDDQSSSGNVDGPSVLIIKLHVPRQELKRKCEIVLLAENGGRR